ncbi:Pseudouridine synthase family protein [Forsythia ovata]|uniref:Pseudouridine synthase family protein n=1 Tax=Forsythia ovata TaxID=205694 RepID=A0ABD1PWB5_9LAMI
MEVENPNPSADHQPQEEEQQPNSKKLKMSTTTSDDDENYDKAPAAADADGTILPRKPRYKRRKIAIFFAYCGVGYQGMQKNPGAKTIEGDLEEALYHSGAVPEQDRGLPKRFDFARSARTDKGVSAVGQVVSGRFYVDPPGLIERLNSNLSPQIRIFGFKRVTGSFNAKKFCDRRRYVYLIPVFALDPSCHRDRESVLASVGSENELVKCLECSERGRKVFGVMGKRNLHSKSDSEAVSVDSSITLNTSSLLELENDEKIVVKTSENGNGNGDADDNKFNTEPVKDLGDGAAQSDKIEEDKVDRGDVDGNLKPEKRSEFSYGEQERERFNRILKFYEGTHNFHNFTTRTKAEDPSAKRFIISFNANTTINVEGIEFVKCEVIGQSFMLHQIRKLIGLAVAIMRNIAPESLIEAAFEQNVNINVPMAPEVGLYLDECFFSSYNKKWKDSHEELSMKAYAEEAEDFKMKYIYSHIASTEHKDGVVALWLHSLNYRNYSDLRGLNSGQSTETKCDEFVDNCQSTDVKHNEAVDTAE